VLTRREKKERKKLIKEQKELLFYINQNTFFRPCFEEDYRAHYERIKQLDILNLRRELKGRYKL
jgi:hypothetical protein